MALAESGVYLKLQQLEKQDEPKISQNVIVYCFEGKASVGSVPTAVDMPLPWKRRNDSPTVYRPQ